MTHIDPTEITIGFEIEDSYIDQDTDEYVINWRDPHQDMTGTARLELAELAAYASMATDHTATVPPQLIDVDAAVEELADRHDVPTNAIRIQRLDAPCEVHYDIEKAEPEPEPDHINDDSRYLERETS